MKHLMALGLLIPMLNTGVFAMSNYDDPRISTGFLDEHMAGALDVLKVTLRARETIEVNIYLRDVLDVPTGLAPGYLLSLHQGGGSRDWFVRRSWDGYSVYRVTSFSADNDIPGNRGGQQAGTLFLDAHPEDLVKSENGRITLNVDLDHIDYAQSLEYDVSSVEGHWNGSSFVVQTWQDNLADERIAAKVIQPLQLFNTLCTGRG